MRQPRPKRFQTLPLGHDTDKPRRVSLSIPMAASGGPTLPVRVSRAVSRVPPTSTLRLGSNEAPRRMRGTRSPKEIFVDGSGMTIQAPLPSLGPRLPQPRREPDWPCQWARNLLTAPLEKSRGQARTQRYQGAEDARPASLQPLSTARTKAMQSQGQSVRRTNARLGDPAN